MMFEVVRIEAVCFDNVYACLEHTLSKSGDTQLIENNYFVTLDMTNCLLGFVLAAVYKIGYPDISVVHII